MKNLKLIPLLIFVAMLSFSVRMVDVFAGLSSLSGAAMAETKTAAAEPKAAPKTSKAAGGLTFEDDVNKPKEELKPAEEEAPPIPPPPTAASGKTEWRDPGDEAPGYQAVRQELTEDLAKRRADLESREKELMTREALLQAGEQELDRKFQELSQLRHEIEQLLEKQSAEETARITSLVKIYEGMKPKDAARIFDTLDLDILVNVMGKMSERKLSPIMAEMNDERARTITIMLAEQKSLPSLPSAN